MKGEGEGATRRLSMRNDGKEWSRRLQGQERLQSPERELRTIKDVGEAGARTRKMRGQGGPGCWDSIPNPWENPGGLEQGWLWGTSCIWLSGQDVCWLQTDVQIIKATKKSGKWPLNWLVWFSRWDEISECCCFSGYTFLHLTYILHQNILCFLRGKSSALCFHFFKTKSLQTMPAQTTRINCRRNCPHVTQTGAGHDLNQNSKLFWWCNVILKVSLTFWRVLVGPKKRTI